MSADSDDSSPSGSSGGDQKAPVSIERLADRVMRLLRQELQQERRRGGEPADRPTRS